jgi:hypothetical protein
MREGGTAHPTSPRPDRQSGLKRHFEFGHDEKRWMREPKGREVCELRQCLDVECQGDQKKDVERDRGGYLRTKGEVRRGMLRMKLDERASKRWRGRGNRTLGASRPRIEREAVPEVRTEYTECG